MGWYYIRLLIWLGGGIAGLFQSWNLQCVNCLPLERSSQAQIAEKPVPPPCQVRNSAPVVDEPRSGALSEEQLRTFAQSITVKVLVGKSWGSGILIQKRGQRYIVLTVRHVLEGEKSYRIQVSNGRIYQATLMKLQQLQGHDLALLQFQSVDVPYAVAPLTTALSLRVGDEVLAVGFPLKELSTQPQEVVFTRGEVTQFINQALVGGYRVGYSNNVVKGMSGGPVLNRRGEIVAINGMHKYPLWGNPYVFEDGSIASPEVQKQMSQFSWAIPIQVFLQLAPQFAVQNSIQKISLKCLP